LLTEETQGLKERMRTRFAWCVQRWSAGRNKKLAQTMGNFLERHMKRSRDREVDRAKGFLMRWRECKRANVAMIFGISLFPLVTAAGAAVDVSRALVVRSRLSQALDSAGLAVGGTIGLNQEQTEQLAQDYFDANYPAGELGVPGALSVIQTGNVVRLAASAEVNTLLMAIVGIETMSVGAVAEITRESKGLEVAMVLDNTGSMNGGGKIGALRDAATSLVNIMFGENPFPEKLRVSLVPFVTAVNINTTGFDMAWMDTTAAATHHGINFDESGGDVNYFDLFDGINNAEWRGCVESRAMPFDVSDVAPDPGNPDTLWVPYFWPDEPDVAPGDFHNNYMNDGIGGAGEDRQAYADKYSNVSVTVDETPSNTSGPNKSCANPLLPLTNDRDNLLGEIADMRAWNNGGTNAAAGLAWGWRILSPTPPFTDNVAYDDEDWKKALILLTDGENQIWGGWDSFNKSNYSSYGYLSEERLDTDDKNVAKGKINDRIEILCDNIKAQGVRIYTITFQLSATAIKQVFQDCATEPELYFDSPSNEALNQTFQAIAQDLSNLRISE
jgi:Flp pilus assembly protein TadG